MVRASRIAAENARWELHGFEGYLRAAARSAILESVQEMLDGKCFEKLWKQLARGLDSEADAATQGTWTAGVELNAAQLTQRDRSTLTVDAWFWRLFTYGSLQRGLGDCEHRVESERAEAETYICVAESMLNRRELGDPHGHRTVPHWDRQTNAHQNQRKS